MKPFCPLLFSVLLLFPIGAFSQISGTGGGTARNLALGGGPANPFLDDLLRIHSNPALASQYGDLIWGDLGFIAADVAQGGSRGQYVAGTFNLFGDHYFGIALNRRESPLYNLDAANPPKDPILEMTSLVASILGVGAQSFGRPMSPIEVSWAMRFDSSTVGASVSYGWWHGDRSGNVTFQQSVSALRAKVGGHYTFDSNMNVELSGLFGLSDVSGTGVSATGVRSELSMTGGMEFGGEVRVSIPFNERWSLIPIARGYWYNWGIKQVRNGVLVIPDPAAEYSHAELEFGVGARYIRDAVQVVGGVSFQQSSLVNDQRISKVSTTIIDLPKIQLGVEFRFTSWLVGRIGYFDRLASTEIVTESAAGKSVATTSTELPWNGDLNGLSAVQQRLTLGLGMQFSGFSLDGTIGEGYFLNGPWPVSGVGQAVFSVLSVSYSL